MTSSGKTSRVKLCQWKLTDPFLMEDMNDDNRKIDAAFAERPLVKLIELTLTQKTEDVVLDFSGIDLTEVVEIQVYFPQTNPIFFSVNDYTGDIHVYTSNNSWTEGNVYRHAALGKMELRNNCGLGSNRGEMLICSTNFNYYYSALVIGPLRKLTLSYSSGFKAGDRFVALGVRL